MEADLAKSLEQLEVKKKTINAESDLTKECQSIIELDHRIALLLKEVKNLRDSVDEQTNLICDNCEQLEPDYRALERASRVYDLSIELSQLNRLCRRIDSSHIFQFFNQTNQIPENVVRRASLNRDNRDGNENDELANQILHETIEKFETLYQPLEPVLSKRIDLPYVSYANKVRKFKQIVGTNASNVEQH